jgi:uncharacterized protein YecE (DUF72 family)
MPTGETVRIGCSGWSYGSWRGRFYPDGLPQRRWLEYYSRTFDCVEVNATFYRLPTRAAVETWAKQVPPGFVFAIKASRYLTHVRRLQDVADGFARLTERISPLADAGVLGPILWQLPANFRRDDERLRAAIGAMRSGRHAIEFRHASWFARDVLEMLARHRVALAIGDSPSRELPVAPPTCDLAYLRLHHGHRGRRGNYSKAELDEWALTIERWDAERTFVFLNNDWEAFAIRNARHLQRRLGAETGERRRVPAAEPPGGERRLAGTRAG